MKYAAWITLLIIGVAVLQGCGETIQGVSDDAHRIGRGVRTIFVSDGQ